MRHNGAESGSLSGMHGHDRVKAVADMSAIFSIRFPLLRGRFSMHKLLGDSLSIHARTRIIWLPSVDRPMRSVSLGCVCRAGNRDVEISSSDGAACDLQALTMKCQAIRPSRDGYQFRDGIRAAQPAEE